jgi:hypothetical protein
MITTHWFVPSTCLMLALLIGGSPTEAADSKINLSAQELEKLLAPTPAATKVDSADLGKLRSRMIALIEQLESSSRTNGPGPESLLSKAIDLRGDLAGVERLLTLNAVLDAWHEANAMGLFNEIRKYTGDITKGRGTGQSCVFELIIPAETYPAASNQLANLRLVPESEARAKGAPLSERELSYQQELIGMIAEKERSAELSRFENPDPTNALGFTAKESLERWEIAMNAAGDAGRQKPNIRLDCKVDGTPSHMTQQRWKTKTTVLNFSAFPTEVTVEIYLLGYTDKNHDYYLMAKKSEPLKLLPNESREVELFTKAESSYKKAADAHDKLTKAEIAESRVRYRGFVVIAKHDDEIISFIGSDQRLLDFGNPASEDSPLSRLPAY